jgi:diguanylate cyclase (GGDEF)-like protein/PAS domain S-box-containing protein
MFSNQSHQQIKKSINAIGTSIALFEQGSNQDFVLVSANALFTEISTQEIDSIVEKNIEEIFPRYINIEIRKSLKECIERQHSFESELVIDKDGKTKWWRCIYSPIYPGEGNLKRVILTSVEITDKKILEKKLEMSLSRYRAVIEAAYDGVISINKEQQIQMINQAAKDMFGVGDETILDSNIENLIPQRFRPKHAEYINSFSHSPVMSRPMQERGVILGLRKDGSEFPAEITISKIKVENDTEMTAVIRDISERSRLMEELQHLSTSDPLTDIYNRRYVEKHLRLELKRCDRFHTTLSIIMFDLDYFKTINDNYGHEKGDQVLLKTVEVTQNIIRDIDIFSRWGGEEFIIVLPETDLKSAEKLAERLRIGISKVSFDWLNQEQQITASFGLAESNGPDSEYDNLLRQVDKAMYAAKNNGRNQVKSNE